MKTPYAQWLLGFCLTALQAAGANTTPPTEAAGDEGVEAVSSKTMSTPGDAFAVLDASPPASRMLAPLPGGDPDENLKVTVHPAGAVALAWWTPRAKSDRFEIRRLDFADSGGDWELLATIAGDLFIDRNTLPGRTYAYEISAADDETFYGRAEVRVDIVRPVAPPHLFEAVLRGDEIEFNWYLPPGARTSGVRIFDAHNGNKPLVEKAPHETRATVAAPADLPPAFRLELLDPGNDKAAASASAELTGRLEKHTDTDEGLRPHPRLFISGPEIRELRAQAETDPSLKPARDALLDEAREALPVLQSGKRDLPRQRGGPHRSNATRARQLALGWAFSGDEAFRAAAADTLLEYAGFYGTIPLKRPGTAGRLSGQTLSEAMMFVNFIWAYDLIYNTLSEEEQTKIEDGLMREGYKTLSGLDRGPSNWQSWHNAALVCFGLVLDDREIISEALYGPSGLLWQIRNTFGRDGLYYAQSIAYHYFTMHAVTLAAEALWQNGYDIFEYQDGDRNLKAIYDVVFWHAFSNGNQAPFGNSQTDRSLTAQWMAWNYAVAYKHYGDPAHLWLWEASSGDQRRNDSRMPPLISLHNLRLAEDAPDGADTAAKPMSFGTRRENSVVRHVTGNTLLGDVGMAVLRGHPDQPSGEAAMIWKPHGKNAGHQHANSLGIHWQSSGHRWISGSGKWAGYSTDVHREWVNRSLSDNVLLVDRKSHEPVKSNSSTWARDPEGVSTAGELEVFTAGPDFGYVRAANRRAYGHAALGRRFINAGVYALDIAGAAASRPALFDYVLHVTGEPLASNLSFEPAGEDLAPAHGYPYLANRRQSAATGESWESVWQDDATDEHFFLTLLGAPQTIYHYATTPWSRDRDRTTLLATREGKHADFVSILRAVPKNEQDPVRVVGLYEDETPGLERGILTVELIDGRRDIHLWSDRMREVDVESLHLRARDASLRLKRQGRFIGATLAQGDLFATDDITLRFEAAANWSLKALQNGSFALFYDDHPPNDLSLDAPSSYRVLLMDGDGKTGEPLMASDEGATRWSVLPYSRLLLVPTTTSSEAVR